MRFVSVVVGSIPTGGLLKSSPSTQHYHGNATDAAHCLRVIDVRPGPCARPGLRMQICSESCFPVCAHGPQTLDRRSAPRICVVLMRKVHICIQYAQNAGFNGPDTVHIRSTYGPQYGPHNGPHNETVQVFFEKSMGINGKGIIGLA